MSSALYTVRVVYEHETGCIKIPGLHRQISRAPVIPGLPALAAIEFTPEINVATLVPHGGELRDMRDDEALAVVAWLRLVRDGAA